MFGPVHVSNQADVEFTLSIQFRAAVERADVWKNEGAYTRTQDKNSETERNIMKKTSACCRKNAALLVLSDTMKNFLQNCNIQFKCN